MKIQDADLVWQCSRCHTPLQSRDIETQFCSKEATLYRRVKGIWRFLPPDRKVFFRRFIQEYETVRMSQERGSTDSQYYRSLPYCDRSRRFSEEWLIRAKSFRAFLVKILLPMERKYQAPLRILDLGAGNGWLSNRLAERGHLAVAG